MKYIVSIGFYIITVICSYGQVNEIKWSTNIKEAKEFAYEKDHNILIVFAGSDWCRPCIRFKEEILLNDLFVDFARENLVVLYLDFPSKKQNRLSKEQKRHNEDLAERFNASGTFPKVLLANPDLEIIKEVEIGSNKVNEIIKILKS